VTPDDGAPPSQIAITAAVDRRTAEALALKLRQRLKALGYDGVSITVAPAPGTVREEPSAD
jgi:hypothetical protein